MRTQVVIIGGGPSGLLLGQLLHTQGIDAVVLERKTRDYVLSRIRAGILETGTISLMHKAGVGARLEAEGFVHEGTIISYGDEEFTINFKEHTDTSVVVYGQTEVTRALYDAREAAGLQTLFTVEQVEIHGADTDNTYVTYNVCGAPPRTA